MFSYTSMTISTISHNPLVALKHGIEAHAGLRALLFKVMLVTVMITTAALAADSGMLSYIFSWSAVSFSLPDPDTVVRFLDSGLPSNF